MIPTICFVHLLDLHCVFALFQDIVVELIPKRQSSKLRTWELCYRVKIQPVDGETKEIEREDTEEEQRGIEGKEFKHPGVP